MADVDGGDAEPGRHRGPVRARLGEAGQGVLGKCLAAAEKAWAAAVANPAVFAGTSAIGGGPYDDEDVSDEFYWAAAELYVTTKKDVYKAFIEKSPHWKKVPMVDGDDQIPTSMTWEHGRARWGRSRWRGARTACRQDIADSKARSRRRPTATSRWSTSQGYRVPFKPGKKGFPWGSNSFVLNNAIVIALA